MWCSIPVPPAHNSVTGSQFWDLQLALAQLSDGQGVQALEDTAEKNLSFGRTFQSVPVTAGEQWLEAGTRSNSWGIFFFLSTLSSPGAEQSWKLLHTYFWASGTSGEHICCRRQEQLGVCRMLEQGNPQRSQISVEKWPEIPVLRGLHMPGSQGTGAADVSHAPLGPPCSSFSPPFHATDIAGVTGIHSCTSSYSLWFGQLIFVDFFLQTQLVTWFWPFFPPVCSAKGADSVRIVWKVLVIPEPVGALTVCRRTGYTSSACPDTTHMLLYDYWWILDRSKRLQLQHNIIYNSESCLQK